MFSKEHNPDNPKAQLKSQSKKQVKNDSQKEIPKETRAIEHSLIHVEPFDSKDLDISDYFTSQFDYVVKRDMYKPHKRTLAVYDLFRQIMADTKKQIKTPIITLSPDPSISAATLAGSAEKFSYTVDDPIKSSPVFKTNLKVIYIDILPDLSTKKYEEYTDFRTGILSDVTGIHEESFSFHRIDIPPENITLIGIDTQNLSDEQDALIRKHNITMHSLKTINKKGISSIMQKVIDTLKYDDVHIVIDLSCMQLKYAPSVIRDIDDKDVGFDFDQMKIIAESLKKFEHLNGVDITGYNFGQRIHKEKHRVSNLLTIKTIEMITSELINLKHQSINFFNEESKFLIWRKVHDYDSLGWYILRNVELEDREELIKTIGDEPFVIISIPDDDIDNNDNDYIDNGYDAMIAITTMKEQNEKSYYTAESLYDFCLYPGEKLNMMFELLNTPILQQAQAKASNKKSKKNQFVKMQVLDDDNTSTDEK